MKIRPFQQADLESIREITRDVFDSVSIDQQIEKTFGIINEKDWKWRLRLQVEQIIQHCPEGAFVMTEEDQVIGWISSVIKPETGIGHIPHMGIRKDSQGKGVGRQLLEFVFNRFREAGLTHVQIETLSQNQVACHLYESIGFQQVSEKIYYAMELPDPDPSDSHAGSRSQTLFREFLKNLFKPTVL